MPSSSWGNGSYVWMGSSFVFRQSTTDPAYRGLLADWIAQRNAEPGAVRFSDHTVLFGMLLADTAVWLVLLVVTGILLRIVAIATRVGAAVGVLDAIRLLGEVRAGVGDVGVPRRGGEGP